MFCMVLSYSQNVVSGMAVEKARRRVDEEREQHLVRFGEIEGALQGAPGGVRIAKRARAIVPSKNAATTQARYAPGRPGEA
jgi:hypothetical protein